MSRFGYRRPDIGEGLVGRVYPAFRLDENDDVVEEGVAMKILLDRWRTSEEMIARFQREVRLQQEELDHPNIMRIVGRNLSADPPYFVMPLASHSLKAELTDGVHEDRDAALEIFRQIAEAMAHAHERKVLHRDLKPANVLFVDDRPCVSDFGFGKRAVPDATDLTQTDQWFGSQRYMAPEQLSAREATAASDVYALGKILGELLTGERPEPFAFDADRMPADYRYFLRRCCDNEPEKRYQNAGDMLDAYRILTDASEVVDPPLEAVNKLVQQWMSTPEGPDIEYVRALDAHLTRYRDEEELYSRAVPKLPGPVLEQYMVAARRVPGGHCDLRPAYLRIAVLQLLRHRRGFLRVCLGPVRRPRRKEDHPHTPVGAWTEPQPLARRPSRRRHRRLDQHHQRCDARSGRHTRGSRAC